MRFLVPSNGPDAWRDFLADPEKQWRKGHSAMELAHSWETAQAFPQEVQQLFSACDVPALRDATPIFGIPEHKVELPGRGAASRNDLFVLASGGTDLISITVEGKVAEPFGPQLSTWLQGASPGKLERLAALRATLGLQNDLPPELRYQLLHRTASAVIEAQRFSAAFAVLIVHSFSASDASLPDYRAFLREFGADHQPESLVYLGTPMGIELYAGWARSHAAA